MDEEAVSRHHRRMKRAHLIAGLLVAVIFIGCLAMRGPVESSTPPAKAEKANVWDRDEYGWVDGPKERAAVREAVTALMPCRAVHGVALRHVDGPWYIAVVDHSCSEQRRIGRYVLRRFIPSKGGDAYWRLDPLTVTDAATLSKSTDGTDDAPLDGL